MKKITMILAVLVLSISMYAQPKLSAIFSEEVSVENLVKNDGQLKKTLSSDLKLTVGHKCSALKADDDDPAAPTQMSTYYTINGALHQGVTRSGSYYYQPMIFVPFTPEVRYSSYWNVPNQTWKIEDRTVSTENFYIQPVEGLIGDDGYLLGQTVPTLSIADFTAKSGTTYTFNDYSYSSNFPGSLYEGTLYAGLPIKRDMTLCYMWDYNEVDNKTRDFFIVGGSEDIGAYSYGTGMLNPWDTTFVKENRAQRTIDTIGIWYETEGFIFLDTIHAWIANEADDVEKLIPANGGQVELTIYPVVVEDDIMYVDRDSVIAKSIATYDDVAKIGSWGDVAFKFEKEDELGATEQVQVFVQGPFYIEFTGFNESGCDFQFWSDYSSPGGSTTFIIDGMLTELWQGGGNNLLVMLSGMFLTLNTKEDVLVVAAEGGDATLESGDNVVLYSSEEFDDLYLESKPDWVEISIDKSRFEDKLEYDLIVKAEASEEYREGQIEIKSVWGQSKVLTIRQGELSSNLKDINSTINDVKKVVRDGRVVILRNGKEYDVLGSQL